MGILDWLRGSFTGQKVCPIEHLESYRRLGEQVYGLHVELAACESPRALAFLEAARSLQKMADSLLGDAFSSFGGASKAVPIITHDQADVWYGLIPDLLVAARQEAAFPGSAKLELPIKLDGQLEGPSPCPIEHLSGLRRASADMEQLVSGGIMIARRKGELYKEVILLYEEARTRKEAGDAIIGTLSKRRRVSAETHEDAEKQYWMALSSYMLVNQGLKAPETVRASYAAKYKTCKLDSDDIWKVTSLIAIREIQKAGEWEQARDDLIEHWETYRIREEEREYEVTVEELLAKGQIKEDGYWYCCPFASTYKAVTPVHVLGHLIPEGNVFVYEYGDNGEPGRFITQKVFGEADSRKYCED
ncbi:hypothetical protein [Paenibacillus ginsengarvi]|uniref:Uncharacterized protein n=1 Tax=Paenibacillus ginsengarvi TaxID=400777 RepID=A0A3B0C6F9_9BACL|nr:hypothetical protein [Paenibacillus ginsengarvi]RKN81965.1 hypothetical protein D7M11_18475 [Paenibacillus ginsengarvi]